MTRKLIESSIDRSLHLYPFHFLSSSSRASTFNKPQSKMSTSDKMSFQAGEAKGEAKVTATLIISSCSSSFVRSINLYIFICWEISSWVVSGEGKPGDGEGQQCRPVHQGNMPGGSTALIFFRFLLRFPFWERNWWRCSCGYVYILGVAMHAGWRTDQSHGARCCRRCEECNWHEQMKAWASYI